MNKNNVSPRSHGQIYRCRERSRKPEEIQRPHLQKITGLTLVTGPQFGGRTETCGRRAAASGKSKSANLTQRTYPNNFSRNNLYTQTFPDPDLSSATSGKCVSATSPLEISYTDLSFHPILLADFSKTTQFFAALRRIQSPHRSFGDL